MLLLQFMMVGFTRPDNPDPAAAQEALAGNGPQALGLIQALSTLSLKPRLVKHSMKGAVSQCGHVAASRLPQRVVTHCPCHR